MRLLHRAWSGIGRMMGYEGASTGRRLGTWGSDDASVNTMLFSDGSIMRSRSRDLVRRNSWASNALDSLVSNMVGSGIKPQSTHEDPEVREAIHSLWRRWVKEADSHGMSNLYGLQALVARSSIESGESLTRMRNRLPSDGLSVPMQLQILEADHLPFSETRELPNGNNIRAGVEFNRLGRQVAYHLYKDHPGDAWAYNGATTRVRASDIAHVFKVNRPGQIRGETWFAQALVKLHELDQYDDAEVVRKKTAAMFAGFILKPSNDETADVDDDRNMSLSPGTMRELAPGEDVRFSDPAEVGGQYAEFMRLQLRSIAVGLGLTYEQLTGDLTGVNYSSIRAGLVEFRRRMEQLQRNMLIHQWCRPVWERWMDQAVLSGSLDLPGYMDDREAYLSVKWVPQGWQWVDPQKEFSSIIMAIRAGLMSRSEAISTYGYDAEEIDRELSEDNARADGYGLVLDTDPRNMTRGGARQRDSSSTGATTAK